jgi:hypothetical protein
MQHIGPSRPKAGEMQETKQPSITGSTEGWNMPFITRNHHQTDMQVIPITKSLKIEGWEETINTINKSANEQIEKISLELNVPKYVAVDIWYLRGRYRWSHMLETAIVDCHLRTGCQDFKTTTGQENVVLGNFGCWTEELQVQRLAVEWKNLRLLRWLKGKYRIQSFVSKILCFFKIRSSPSDTLMD